ncbi:MAG: glycoside hydrolase family 3 N-terminal domain-containing protein [Enterococcus italicus]|uniref:glycoside hydrolase family 3 N-terminal domain-containing protein n=1 Tax=Enterococcus italicus TaxID=246144 RepID=UPI003996B3EC
MKKNHTAAWILFGFTLLFALLAGGVWLLMNQSEKKAVIKASSSETTSSTRTSVDPQQTIEQIITNMTLEEKVGQLFFSRVPESNQIEDIQQYHLGGYVLFGRDVQNESIEGLKGKIRTYQAASEIPLLIGSDEEGGMVTRISRNTNLVKTPFASPQEIYQESGLAGIVADTKRKSEVLKAFGIHTGLFPVADVATDPQAFIYDRTLGTDAAETSAYVAAVVKELKAEQVGSTLKHFPGYGDNRDSHVEIVTDTRSLSELRENDFLPFQAGIVAGADSVMVSHTIVTSIDATQPASISPAVHQLLRQELGFQGVIMTDDMDMAGLADFISQEEAGLKALQAGNDFVMSSSYNVQIPYVIQAVKDGQYSEHALNQSVKRILTWKQSLGLIADK